MIKIQTDKNYSFPNQWDAVFKSPEIIIDPVVKEVNPATKTINVLLTIELRTKEIDKDYHPDINPVPVNNLSYDDPQTLVDRINDRLKDFEV